MDDLDVRALARVINQGDAAPSGGDLKLRRGVVAAVGTRSATVTIGGTSVAGIPVYRGVAVRVGDTVDVLLDGPAPRVIGGVNTAGPMGLLAYSILASATPTGLYANGVGLPTAAIINPTTTEGNTGLMVAAVPIETGRLLRLRFQFWAGGTPSTTNEWYFLFKTLQSGGGWTTSAQVRYAPSGGNAGSPMGEMLFTSSVAGTFNVGINVIALNAGGTPALFQWNASSVGMSQLTVEDLGRA